jgi:hypothetical protein
MIIHIVKQRDLFLNLVLEVFLRNTSASCSLQHREIKRKCVEERVHTWLAFWPATPAVSWADCFVSSALMPR